MAAYGVITAGVIFNMILAFIYTGMNWSQGKLSLPIEQVAEYMYQKVVY